MHAHENHIQFSYIQRFRPTMRLPYSQTKPLHLAAQGTAHSLEHRLLCGGGAAHLGSTWLDPVSASLTTCLGTCCNENDHDKCGDMVLDWWMKQQGKPGTPQNENENETETDPTRTDAKTQSSIDFLSSIKHMVLRKQEQENCCAYGFVWK